MLGGEWLFYRGGTGAVVVRPHATPRRWRRYPDEGAEDPPPPLDGSQFRLLSVFADP